MKKTVSFILLIVIMLLAVVPSVASDTQISASDDNLFADAVSYTCIYDEKSGKIKIDGSVNHDITLKYPDYELRVYMIAPGESAENVINSDEYKYLASTAMTIKFTFGIPAETIIKKYSSYAIVFCAPDGEEYIAGTPTIPSVSSDFKYVNGDRTSFKGILLDSPARMGDSGSGRVIIDVNLTLMNGDRSDVILYPVRDKYVSFRKSYVEELDKKIHTAASSGANVYLRFLLGAADSRLSMAVSPDPTKYGIPNVHNEATLEFISALSTFLVERYDEDGGIAGIVVGNKIDDVDSTNYIGDMTLEEYGDAYTLYLTVIASSMRSHYSNVDVVIPISCKDVSFAPSALGFSTAELLEHVISSLEYGVSGEFPCSVMIQSDVTPFGITNRNILNGIDMSTPFGQDKIHTENLQTFIEFTDELSEKYHSAPSNVIYMWEADAELRGSALGCAYAYTYFVMSAHSKVSSFVISLNDSAAYDDIQNVLRYIDTEQVLQKTQPLLKFFGAENWNDVIGAPTRVDADKKIYQTYAILTKAENYIGRFSYFDFSSYDVFKSMFAGENCLAISSTHDIQGNRALQIKSDALNIGNILQCGEKLENKECFMHTPVISLKLCVNDNVNADSLYEVELTLGNNNTRVIASGAVRAGEISTLYFDISSLDKRELMDNIKLSIRPLTHNTQSCSVWLYELSGYSSEYTSEELADKIEEQRNRILGVEGVSDSSSKRVFLSVLGVVFVIAIVGLGLFTVFGREGSEKDTEK